MIKYREISGLIFLKKLLKELTIEDVIGLPGARSAQRVESDFSQAPAGTQSTSRNTLGNV